MEKRNDQPSFSKEVSQTDRETRDRLRIEKQDPLNFISTSVDELKRKRDTTETKTSTKKSAPSTTSSSTQSRIEQLRAERLKRESAERTKAAAYLRRVFTGNEEKSETPEPTPVIETDDRKRKYNSQFNPTMAKQNGTRYATTDFSWRQH